MALAVLQEIAEGLEDLIKDRPELLKDSGTSASVKQFLAYARDQVLKQKASPKTYLIRINDVEDQVIKLIKSIGTYYRSIAESQKRLDDLVEKGAKFLMGGGDTSQQQQQQQQQQKKPEEMPNPLPRDVDEFLQQIIKMIKDKRTSIYTCKRPATPEDILFEDLAGLAHEKEQMRVGYIYPQKFPGLFKSSSRGILLYGPPGTGKTMLAKAATRVIGENVAFFPITAGEIKDKFVGETGKAIARVWNCATELLDKKPDRYKLAVIFIDEADDLGGSRTGPDAFAKDSVNELLQRMDGLTSDPRISVLAATNYPDRLDDAFLRRFDMRIYIDVPDRMGRFGLIVNELAKAYALPGASKKLQEKYPELTEDDRRKNMEIRGYRLVFQAPGKKPDPEKELSIDLLTPAASTLFNTLKNYGSTIVQTKEIPSGWFSSGSKQEKLAPLSVDDIRNLVTRTGPQLSAADVMKRRKELGGQKEFSKDAFSKYGYSASDLSKVIKRAVGLAALRAIDNRVAKVFKPVVFDTDPETYYVYDIDDKLRESDGVVGAAVSLEQLTKSDDDEFKRRSTKKDVTAEDLRKFKRTTDRVLNFTINIMDLSQAMDQFKSTIKAEGYEAVAKWEPNE